MPGGKQVDQWHVNLQCSCLTLAAGHLGDAPKPSKLLDFCVASMAPTIGSGWEWSVGGL
jgi:hypothetical protein